MQLTFRQQILDQRQQHGLCLKNIFVHVNENSIFHYFWYFSVILASEIMLVLLDCYTLEHKILVVANVTRFKNQILISNLSKVYFQ